ncbi:hypothetical protein [Phytomonospora endophytica]|uniref:VWA domain-containing protein n=1 Tax=Phytomonospora endophytica TaxID=714109 RepID=A0A841FMK4_9ACTN|nr:hypothetical protein [Phytomonospora endophytica]MBB6038531.1 hypothetical protein [Phytomonospora endophytica]GIG69329.1 hypothetical protein Pen01_56240 [Phytomonospora endophytica]
MTAVPHIHTDPKATPATSSHSGWLRVSADLAVLVRVFCDRSDLVVIAAPGASPDAPGCYKPGCASIELDSDICFPGIDPAGINATDPLDLPRYAAGIGVLVHEAAHARHSRWREDHTWPRQVRDAALLLEELRIEAAQLRRRGIDRDWLRASTKTIIAPNLTITDPKTLTPTDAATAAALLLGRVDAEVLTPIEVAAARTALSRALTATLLGKLERIWRAAILTGDNDAARTRRLAHQWCTLLDDDKVSGPGSRTKRKTTARRRGITAAMNTAAQIAADPFTTQQTITPLAGGTSPGTSVFARHHGLPTRAASSGEHRAARRLAQTLQDAAVTERITTTVTSRVPPGRLRMRAVLTGRAQEAAGAPVTAEPWRATRRKRPPAPRPTVGIALDVSISMGRVTDAACAAAWICAHAAAHAHGAAAAVTFGAAATALVAPGRPPERIPQPPAENSTDHLDIAIDALDEALGLSHHGHDARILVLVTDGRLARRQAAPVLQRLTGLAASGCALVQITPEGPHVHLPHTTLVCCTDPAAAVTEITAAVATAMATAKPAT